jgi:hypothetical protein
MGSEICRPKWFAIDKYIGITSESNRSRITGGGAH